MLGVSNKVEYELLISSKTSLSLVKDADKRGWKMDDSISKVLSAFLSVSIGTIYQPDLYYLTMPLLVQSVQIAGNSFRISSEPPQPEGRKHFGDTAIYEIVDQADFTIRVLVELRTEQSPCALRSVLMSAYKSMIMKKAGTVMLVIDVYSNCPIKVVEVSLVDNDDKLEIQKVVEFNLISVRPRKMNEQEASAFIQQLSLWLKHGTGKI